MLINGYDEEPVVDGEELIALPGFWASYPTLMCKPDDRQRFGVDDGDVYEASEALMDEESWPALRVPFADGHRAVVAWRELVHIVNNPDAAAPESSRLARALGTWPV